MKKLLLSIFCLFSIMGYAAAEEVKFDFTAPSKLTPSITDAMFQTTTTEGAYEFATSGTTFNINGITINTTDGSTVSRIWKAASGKYDLRLYKTATMTITAPEGATITSIAFTGGTVDSFSADNGTLDGKNWTGSASKIVFTWSSSAKTQKINDITVAYTGTATGGGEGEGEGGGETVEPDPEQPEVEVQVQDISAIIAAGAGVAKTEALIVATYAKGFLLSDGDAEILVYLGTEHNYKVGNYVTVTGNTSMYGGLLQFAQPTVELVENEIYEVEYPAATTMTGDAMDDYLNAPAIKYVEYTGKLTISGNYYNVAVEGASTAIASIQYPNEGLVPAELNNATIKVTGYTIGFSGGKYINTMATKVELIEEGEPEPEEPITGEILTVSQALAAFANNQTGKISIKGYIVGAIDGKSISENANFSASVTTNTNIMIAEDADETDIDKCIPVQLPSGNIRNELNLVDNSGHYKKEVILEGSLEKYFGVAGLKSTSKYQFTTTTEIENIDAEVAETVIYDLTGRRVEEITSAGIYIVNGVKKVVR